MRFALAVLLLVVGCASAHLQGDSPYGVEVVEDADSVDGCESLGSVRTWLRFDSRYEPVESGIARALEDLQLQTLTLGGDTLLSRAVEVRPQEIRAHGTAYRCRKEP